MEEIGAGVVLGVIIGVILTVVCINTFTYGMKTGNDVEILDSVCDYIYENESKDVYIKYCE